MLQSPFLVARFSARLSPVSCLSFRSLATSVSGAQGRVDYPPYNPFPLLRLQLPDSVKVDKTGSNPAPKEILFAIRPWHTVSTLSSAIREEDADIQQVTLYQQQASSTASGTSSSVDVGSAAKWSGPSPMEDVLRAGLRLGTESQQPLGFLIECNGVMIPVTMPSMEERLKQYKEDLAILQEKLSPLELLKKQCDKKASSHSRRLVWAGFGGLVTQWVVLARLTWWEFSWDVIEPITWFMGMGNSILAYSFFLIYRRDFSVELLSTMSATQKQLKLYDSVGLDIKAYNHVCQEIKEVEDLIEGVREQYHH